MCGGSPLRIARCFASIYFYMIPTTCTYTVHASTAPANNSPCTAPHIIMSAHCAHIYKFIHTNRAHMNVLLQRVVALPSTYFSVYIYTSLQKYARCISWGRPCAVCVYIFNNNFRLQSNVSIKTHSNEDLYYTQSNIYGEVENAVCVCVCVFGWDYIITHAC